MMRRHKYTHTLICTQRVCEYVCAYLYVYSYMGATNVVGGVRVLLFLLA